MKVQKILQTPYLWELSIPLQMMMSRYNITNYLENTVVFLFGELVLLKLKKFVFIIPRAQWSCLDIVLPSYNSNQ